MVCKQTESPLLSATLPLQIQFVYTLFGQFVYTPSIWVLYTPFVYTLFDQFVYTLLDLGTLHTFCLHKLTQNECVNKLNPLTERYFTPPKVDQIGSKWMCKQTESPLVSATLPPPKNHQKLNILIQNECVNKLNPPC